MTWSDRDYSEIWNDGEAFTLYITVPAVTIAPVTTPVEEGDAAAVHGEPGGDRHRRRAQRGSECE